MKNIKNVRIPGNFTRNVTVDDIPANIKYLIFSFFTPLKNKYSDKVKKNVNGPSDNALISQKRIIEEIATRNDDNNAFFSETKISFAKKYTITIVNVSNTIEISLPIIA